MTCSIRTLWPLAALCLASCRYGSGAPPAAEDGTTPDYPLAVASGTLGGGRVGQPYTAAVDATGGTPPYAYRLAELPAELSWVSLDPATGLLSGVPTAPVPAGAQLLVEVTDAGAATASGALVLAVTLCDPGARIQTFHAAAGQCRYDLQLCSADGGTSSGESGTPSTSMDHCGAGADGATCGACSTALADACVDGRCACGLGAACTAGSICCSGACRDDSQGKGCDGDIICPEGTMRCSEGCCAHAVAVAAGGSATCALLQASDPLGLPAQVKCWGDGPQGQLGTGTSTHADAPILASKVTGAARLAAGPLSFCAVTTEGKALCWGNTADGELGNGTPGTSADFGPGTPVSLAPVDGAAPQPLSGLARVAAGGTHACALDDAGAVWCWGNDFEGEVGDGGDVLNTKDVVYAVRVGKTAPGSDMPAAQAIAAGTDFTCAIESGADHAAYCWGGGGWYWNTPGVGNLDKATQAPNLTRVKGVTELAAGGSHVCAITAERTVKCWGDNSSGQLGNGSSTTPSDLAAVDVVVAGATATPALLSDVVQLAAGYAHVCARTSGGAVWCWGNDERGQLGHAATDTCSVRRVESWEDVPCSTRAGLVTGLSAGAVDLSAGASHTCAALSTGGVKCWGDNEAGQLGLGATEKTESQEPLDVLF